MTGSPERPGAGGRFDIHVLRTIKTSLTLEATDAAAAFEAAIESGLRFAQPSEWSPVPGGWELVLFGVGETSDTVVCQVREAGARPVGAAAVIAQLTADLDEARAEVERLRSEAELHALCNGGCVPSAAYRDVSAALAGLRAGLELRVRAWDEASGDLVPPLPADAAWKVCRDHVADLRTLLAETEEAGA